MANVNPFEPGHLPPAYGASAVRPVSSAAETPPSASTSTSTSTSTSKSEDDDPDAWNPRQALAQLEVERTKLEDMTEVNSAERIFRENLPVAAKSICHMAAYSRNESTRFKAAQYVVERNLGRIADSKPLSTDPNDPFVVLMRECGLAE